MSGANSAPVFEQRAKELGVPEDLIDSLKAAHVNSFARLAYLTPYQPGQPDDQVLFDKPEEIATRHLHDFEKACFRQLFYMKPVPSLCRSSSRRWNALTPQNLLHCLLQKGCIAWKIKRQI